MKQRFGALPIRRKLVLMTLASSSAAVLFATGGFFAWDAVQFRQAIERDLIAQARTISENSTAPLTFGDTRAAEETLAVLDIFPNVESACMYTAGGPLFATFYQTIGGTCPPLPADGEDFSWRTARLVTPIVLDGRRVGTLLIERNLNDLIDRLAVGGLMLLGFLVLATILALAVGHRMQRTIASPLMELAATARTVSESKDYSLRGVAKSHDEVGVLVEAFNEMLDRIEERTEELSRANRLKDEFLATLSHELRTPLNAVLGWTSILRSKTVPAAVRTRALETIDRNARLQARLVEDLLEVSRIVSGKLHLKVQPTDLSAVIQSAVEIVQPGASSKGIELAIDIPFRPAMTSGDPDRLHQIVWNLLSNAVRFTPRGGRVTVALARNHEYVLSVTDTGIGIDAAFLPHIFQPFRQADASPSREHGGLGLGLAIVRHLAELHGGTVSARSDGVGKGTTFEVRLPSMLAAANVSPPPPASESTRAEFASLDPDTLPGIRVLAVEDDDDARELVRISLESCGATVTCVASAAEAMAAMERAMPDVIVSDIGMTTEDGYSLMRRIRARRPGRGGQTPAIALTAYAAAADRQAAFAAGFDAHVAKPFEPAELAAIVRRLAGVSMR